MLEGIDVLSQYTVVEGGALFHTRLHVADAQGQEVGIVIVEAEHDTVLRNAVLILELDLLDSIDRVLRYGIL